MATGNKSWRVMLVVHDVQSPGYMKKLGKLVSDAVKECELTMGFMTIAPFNEEGEIDNDKK